MDIWGWIVIGVVVVVVLLLKLAKDTWNAEKAIPGCGALLGCLSIPLWLAAAIVFAFLVLVYNATHPTPPPKSAHLPPPTTSMLSQAPTPSQTTGSLVGEWLENDGKRRFVFHSATSGTGQLVEIYTRSGHGWNAWQASVSTAERVDLNGLAWDGNNYWVQNGNDIRTSFAATHLDLPP